MNASTDLQSQRPTPSWQAPPRAIEAEPWLFAALLVAVVLAIGAWQPEPKAAPSSPADQSLASAPVRG